MEYAMPMSFFRPRPSGGPLAGLDQSSSISGTESLPGAGRASFEPIPFRPRGTYPYRLDLEDILGAQAVNQITGSGRLVFHVAGDTGGVKSPEAQTLVAQGMERSFANNLKPASFFYHLGDVVYYSGEVGRYFDQFYDPYEHYPAPIFAIAGNHDGATSLGNDRSLVGFERNFCAEVGTYTKEAMDTRRMAICQPYVYWALDSPFAYFIGLYTNVPEGGQIDSDQRRWFRDQLSQAPTDKALILTMHHPVFSFDIYHSGSPVMARELVDAVNYSRRVPNLILTAHVHNFQRIEKTTGTKTIPFLVIGNGGYWHLHALSAEPGHRDSETGVSLVAGIDDRHGFVTLEVTSERIDGFFTTVPRAQESWAHSEQYKRADAFSYDARPIRLASGEMLRLQS